MNQSFNREENQVRNQGATGKLLSDIFEHLLSCQEQQRVTILSPPKISVGRGYEENNQPLGYKLPHQYLLQFKMQLLSVCRYSAYTILLQQRQNILSIYCYVFRKVPNMQQSNAFRKNIVGILPSITWEILIWLQNFTMTMRLITFTSKHPPLLICDGVHLIRIQAIHVARRNKTNMRPQSKPVVPNFFLHILPFIKQDFQIYPQCTQWSSFIENTKVKNSFEFRFRMIYSIKMYISYNI